MKTLLLWDIDGTLIASGGAGMKSMQVALGTVFGIDGSVADIEFSGRTDRWIIAQIFRKFGVAPTEDNFTRFFESYVAGLPAMLSNPQARILPGVHAALAAAAADGTIAQGLLTGNMRRGAQAKLTYHGLWDHFPFGAFADDSEHRNELGPHALRRAREHHGVEFAGVNVWIIGDTPHDIACGKAIGARTLGVATGSHPLDELLRHAPSAVLADLSDTAALLRLFTQP